MDACDVVGVDDLDPTDNEVDEGEGCLCEHLISIGEDGGEIALNTS